MYSSPYLWISPSIDLFVYLFIQRSIHFVSIYPIFYVSIYLFLPPFFRLRIAIYLFLHPIIIYLCITPSIYLSLYLFNDPYVYFLNYISVYPSSSFKSLHYFRAYFFIYLSTYLRFFFVFFLDTSVYLYMFWYMYPSIYLSIHLNITGNDTIGCIHDIFFRYHILFMYSIHLSFQSPSDGLRIRLTLESKTC